MRKVLGACLLVAALALFGFLIWAALDARHLHQGTVIERTHSPGYTSSTWVSDGDRGGRLSYTHIPPHWSITIRGMRDDGKLGERTVNVDREEWLKLKIGDQYVVDGRDQ